MEQTDFKTKLKTRLAVYAALAVLVYGAFAHFYNPHTAALTAGAQPLNLLVLTRQPMFISYNPQSAKAAVTNMNTAGKKSPGACDALKEAGINPQDVLYIRPSSQNRAEFWELCKNNLRAWRQKPYIIFIYLYDYIRLRVSGRTNIAPSDFVMITLHLMRLEPGDFTVKNPDPPPAAQNRRRAAAAAPQQILLAQNAAPAAAASASKTLVLEVLNASGGAGLAAEVTRYLRDLSNRGLIDIDVINYGNYPVIEEKSKITDITGGRPEDLKKIGRLLGMDNSEIFTSPDKTAIADAKIILGKDFILPKTN
ncbi:MAG: LytR C-terminal domain-containing protein [Elusimicrobiota bacterium]|jgi:hypothetical protein|nr:LytR C-terminal domain-containing protein [Elusimicrobiota bacterium]